MNATLLIAVVLLGQAPTFKPGDHVVMNAGANEHGIVAKTSRSADYLELATAKGDAELFALLARNDCLISIPNGTPGVVATKPIAYNTVESRAGIPAVCYGVRFAQGKIVYVSTLYLMTEKQRADWRANEAKQLEAKKQATDLKAKEKLKNARVRSSPLP